MCVCVSVLFCLRMCCCSRCVRCLDGVDSIVCLTLLIYFILFFSNDHLNWPLDQFRIKWLWLIIYFFACAFFSDASLRWIPFGNCVIFDVDLVCSAHMCSICNNIFNFDEIILLANESIFSLFLCFFWALKILLAKLNTHRASIALNFFFSLIFWNYFFFLFFRQKWGRKKCAN